MRNPLPYAHLDWKKCERIHTTNHTHITREDSFRNALARGYELLTISNYYPSKPCYPLSSIKKNTFALFQEQGLRVNDTFQEGPFNWNEIIGEWKEELGEEEKANFPFTEGEPFLPPLPEGIMEAPNAEHHSFPDCDLIMDRGFHITAPGAMWASGHFDKGNKYHLKDHGYMPGAGLPWKEGFKRILESLLWEEGGGIIINHPSHTRAPLDFLLEALDYDDRVLGIEVWNTTQSSEDTWDSILRTGRQCFGFFAPDHFNKLSEMYNPMNILLTEERTPRSCMKAYRDGSLYGCLFHSGLAFEEITFEGDTLFVRTGKEAFIEVLGAPGVLAYARGRELEYPLSLSKGKILYLRVRASDGTGERIFSQPIFIP